MSSRVSNPLNSFFKYLIIGYQATISAFLGGNCRYYPSCSHYAKEAFEKHSFGNASFLVFRRVFSCHPLSRKDTFDPVPQSFSFIQERGVCEHS